MPQRMIASLSYRVRRRWPLATSLAASLATSVVRGALLGSALLAHGRAHAAGASTASLLYVSAEEGGEVVIIDAGAGEVVGRVPVGKRPRGLKLSGDGKHLFVALSGSP